MKILVAEDERFLNETMVSIVQGYLPEAEVFSATDGEQAIRLITENRDFLCVFSDYNMPKANGGEVFRHLMQVAPQSKFVLVSTDTPSIHSVFDGADIEFVEKPFLEKFEAILSELAKSHQSSALPEYFQVSVPSLHTLGQLEWDIYIGLSEKKHVKVLHSGSSFTDQERQQYEKKGIEYLFIERKRAKDFIQAMISKSARLFDSEPSFVVETIQLAANSLGVTPEVQELAKKTVSTAIERVQNSKGLSGAISDVLSRKGSYVSNHSLALSYISCYLTAKLPDSTPEKMEAICLASLMHDACVETDELAKLQTQENLKSNSSKYSESQIADYQNHPNLASEVVKAFTDFPTLTSQIIEQHHERPDGTGFPRGLTVEKFYPMSAVFIIAHALLDEMREKDIDLETPEFYIRLESRYSTGVFYDVIGKLKNSN